MPQAQMPGGRRRIDEDTVRVALIFAAALLVLFFLLVVRVTWDKKEGKPIAAFKPVRNRGALIRAVLPER